MWKLIAIVVIFVALPSAVQAGAVTTGRIDWVEIPKATTPEVHAPQGRTFSREEWPVVTVPDFGVVKAAGGKMAFTRPFLRPIKFASGYAYSIKRVSIERRLTPTVSYTPGEGLIVKLRPQESLLFQRSSDYLGDCQVFWKKTY
ncbi:MAG: hypothetical protein H6Q75_79 [Firmicutes bacterium]|nr:hypothetical protein [Bacillota bacterium]